MSKRKINLNNRSDTSSNDEGDDDIELVKVSKTVKGGYSSKREYSNEQERLRRLKLRNCRENFRRLCPSSYLDNVRRGSTSSKRQPTRIDVLKGVLKYLEDNDRIEKQTFSLINELQMLDQTMTDMIHHYESKGVNIPSNLKSELISSTRFAVRQF